MTVVVSTAYKAPTVRDEAKLDGDSVGDPAGDSTMKFCDSTVKENFWPCSQWLLTVQMMYLVPVDSGVYRNGPRGWTWITDNTFVQALYSASDTIATVCVPLVTLNTGHWREK